MLWRTFIHIDSPRFEKILVVSTVRLIQCNTDWFLRFKVACLQVQDKVACSKSKGMNDRMMI